MHRQRWLHFAVGADHLHQVILTRKRSGKSYTAFMKAEELLRNKQQVVMIGSTDDWGEISFVETYEREANSNLIGNMPQ